MTELLKPERLAILHIAPLIVAIIRGGVSLRSLVSFVNVLENGKEHYVNKM